FDRQVLVWAFAVGLPGALAAAALLVAGDFSGRVVATVLAVVGVGWMALALALRRRVVYPLYTLANLLEALRLGDTSLRARRGGRDDALGQVLAEVNALRDTLREQRLGEREATVLLSRVVDEIDAAVFAFDGEDRLRLANRAGERLLDRSADRLLGRSAAELGLGELLSGPPHRVVARSFAGGGGRWDLRRSIFRQEGRPHRLVVLTDLSRTLREEERQTWKRLIRVLGHELNNSLAPIKSMAATLAGLLARRPRPDDWQEDMAQGLDVISNRAESLARFLAAYSRLARLPAPRRTDVRISRIVERVAALERRLPLRLAAGPEVIVSADPDQLEQLLINLVKNAVEAASETGGGVEVGWRYVLDGVEVWVRDEGPGISNVDNLFVPFYTTKEGGSGIGLVLSRQIAEAHGGELTLENAAGGGCEARLRLPLGD
ncbi:MAG TPA: ATP-binding protein, partial [Thermoanaerobaculia bacterium]|nr:ATP-binding protein [Thermoanaerobaculia bacterium]